MCHSTTCAVAAHACNKLGLALSSVATVGSYQAAEVASDFDLSSLDEAGECEIRTLAGSDAGLAAHRAALAELTTGLPDRAARAPICESKITFHKYVSDQSAVRRIFRARDLEISRVPFDHLWCCGTRKQAWSSSLERCQCWQLSLNQAAEVASDFDLSSLNGAGKCKV